MSKADYDVRLLEIHGDGMWTGFHIDRAVSFCKQFGFTGIVLHCSDMLERIIKPEKYFEKKEAMSFYKNREGNVKNYQYYFASLCEKVASADLELYVEEKEIGCADEVLQKYTWLRDGNGRICPTNPFWWEFVEEKFNEFCLRFPTVSGIIVSCGTRECKVSLAGNRCTCERCKDYDKNQWYRELITSMHKALDVHGKRLVVRDFAYTAGHQYAMIEAASDVSKNIVMALKSTPHDYYPVFPDNPTIGHCNGMQQWIEFDAWGQFFGLGVFPTSVVGIIKDRMTRYKALGANGVIFRTDWERLLNSSCFNSFSIVNLIAGGLLGQDVNTTVDEIYEAWLAYGLVSPLLADSFNQDRCTIKDDKTKAVLKRLVEFSWEFMKKTIYIRDHVFNRNTQLFDMYYLTYYIMTVHHTRDHWEPGASAKVMPTDENLPIIFKEKDEAVEMADSLKDWLVPQDLAVSEGIREYLGFLVKVCPLFAREMSIEAKAAVLAKRALDENSPKWKEKALVELKDVDSVAEKVNDLIKGHCYTNAVVYVFDGDRLKRFRDSVVQELSIID